MYEDLEQIRSLAKDEKINILISYIHILIISMSDFPKQYDPKIHESASQELWENNKIYRPDSNSKSTFYIPIPPPNVTGNLHLGHALTLSIEDIMIRYHRLRGDATLWVP